MHTPVRTLCYILRIVNIPVVDCVNCIRFLDSRTFASCSDDTSVVLWDVRNLKSRVRTLRGHSNWVKNIEYNTREGLLVTSGFDGAIFTWDINKYQERQAEYKRVFHTNGLMRMRLTAGCDKMVISTMNGYLMVVHDLDLEMLSQDLAGFKPNMYRMMQTSGKPIEMAVHYTKLFHAKRNRVELISGRAEFTGITAVLTCCLQTFRKGMRRSVSPVYVSTHRSVD